MNVKSAKKISRANEFSAGGIVVCLSGGIRHVLLIRDSRESWTFPKGKIDKGETSRTAARREVTEETGVSGFTYRATLAPVTYWYFRKRSIHKKVEYYLFESSSLATTKPQAEEGITRAEWVPLPDALDAIGYRESNVPLLEEVRRILEKR